MTDQNGFKQEVGFILIAVGAVLFGTIGVATKGLFAVSSVNAISITLWRALIALPVLFVIGLYLLRGRLFVIPWRDLRLMIVAGILMAFYQVVFVVAVQLANVTIATLVTLCTVPIIVTILAAAFLREALHRGLFLAMGCAIAGVILLVGFSPTGNLGTNALLGVVLSLLTALANGIFQITTRALAGRYHPIQTLTVYFLVAALAFIPIAVINGFVTTFPPLGWALLFHLGIIVSVIAYLLLLTGLRTTPATIATIIGFLEPLTATILAVVIFDEQLGPTGVFGVILLLAAMAIVWRLNSRVQKLVPE